MQNGNVKLLMNWDIKPGLDQEYFEFVMREWVPNTTKLGLTPIEAWYSVYTSTDIPRIMAGAIAEDEEFHAPDHHQLRLGRPARQAV